MRYQQGKHNYARIFILNLESCKRKKIFAKQFVKRKDDIKHNVINVKS